MDDKAPGAFRTISEVADELDLPQHVLRFWESRFSEIKPMKRGGGRRYYRPADVDLLRGIRHLLYGEGYTIRGVQRILRDQGVDAVQILNRGASADAQHEHDEPFVDTEGHDAEADEIEEIDADEEPRGLGERLGALIGRDLNEHGRQSDRTEPSLFEAPTPRVDLGDRLGGVERIAPVSTGPSVTPEPVRPRTPIASLSAEQSARLRRVLDELQECRRKIDASLAPNNRQ